MRIAVRRWRAAAWRPVRFGAGTVHAMVIEPMSVWIAIQALLGGGLIGAAAAALLLFNGRIAGVSGIVGGLLPPRQPDAAWRVLFVVGLLVGGLCLGRLVSDPFEGLARTPALVLVPAGLLVGFGAGLGGGCTSGHGVCGISRLSPRSMLATAVFMLAGGATVFVVRHLVGVAW
ncbi:MAG: YeeE/YedE thiosulfate transporter family protein [Deltaproteobacteria bacterium]|nr:YeeE/YedE thiosulfate transporter family protein [Deltaproteobacteria bacterium]